MHCFKPGRIFALCMVFALTTALAQEKNAGIASPVVVDIQNLQEYQAELPEFIAIEVGAGKLPLHIIQAQKASAAAVQEVKFEEALLPRLEKELSDNRFLKFSNENPRGLLWNQYLRERSFPSTEFSFMIREWLDGVPVQPFVVEGQLKRLKPGAGTKEKPAVQAFRERLFFIKPGNFTDLQFLTIRLFSRREDAFWMVSDALPKVLKLEGVNRYDTFSGGVLALNDLLVTFPNPQDFEIGAVEQQKVFQPVLRDQGSIKTERTDSCFSHSLGKLAHKRNMPHLDGFSGRIFSDLDFVMDNATVVDVINTTRYAATGRERLWFNSQTGALVYRVVYDRSGKLRKWNMFVTSSRVIGEHRLLLPLMQFTKDPVLKKSAFVKYTSVKYCSSLDKEEPSHQIKFYDPSNLSSG